MVMMLRQCCCGCSLQTGTKILGLINIVSANFLSTVLTVYRNGGSFGQEQKQMKENKLHSCSWNIGTNHSNHVRKVYCSTCTLLINSAKENMIVKKEKIFYICIHQSRCKQDFVVCGRLNYTCSACHKTVNKGEWNYNKNACIL